MAAISGDISTAHRINGKKKMLDSPDTAPSAIARTQPMALLGKGRREGDPNRLGYDFENKKMPAPHRKSNKIKGESVRFNEGQGIGVSQYGHHRAVSTGRLHDGQRGLK